MWKPSIVAREIWLNLVGDRWRALLVLFVIAGLSSYVSVTELKVGIETLETADALRRGGMYAYIVEAPPTSVSSLSDNGLGAARCVALENLDHVVAAGGYSLGDSVRLDRAPGMLFERAATVGRIAQLWDAELQDRGTGGATILVPKSAAADFGIVEGQALRVDSQTFSQVGLFDPGARFPEAAVWLGESVGPEGRVEKCAVELFPNTARPGAAGVRAWFADTDAPVSVSPMFVADEFTRDPAREFETRSNRYAWVAVGFALGLAFAVVAWFKRGDIALYKALGSGRAQTASLFVAQGTILLSAGWALAISASVVAIQLSTGGLTPGILPVAIRSSALAMLTSAVLQAVVFTLVAFGPTAQQIKERP